MICKRKSLLQFLVTVSLFISEQTFAAGNLPSDSSGTPSFSWIQAPAQGEIASKARIKLDGGFIFLASDETKRFLTVTGNPPSENSYTLASGELGWFAIFDFIGDGYVKDDEKIDPDALLQTLKTNNEKGLEVRRQKNLPLLYLDGWHIPPRYDSETKRLEWAIKLHDETNAPLVNFTTRLLGRGGYMSATLVSDPNNLNRDIQSFKTALKGYEFIPGERYYEFRSGDKVAAYGLGALVVGGAAAAVASKGGFKVIGYVLVAAFAGVVAFLKKLFSKK